MESWITIQGIAAICDYYLQGKTKRFSATWHTPRLTSEEWKERYGQRIGNSSRSY